MYKIDYTDSAKFQMQLLKRNEPRAFQKLMLLLEELMQHPRTGTGHPEPLRGKPEGRWSRRVSQKHRLVYRIFDDEVVVLVLAASGHYGDK
ncbi:MAG: Txe/YoeB family addiction module toxin [Bacteroidales bacterium]|nr:Txe/YoeB family addiction module toxin [Bacteroidales bacterium]